MRRSTLGATSTRRSQTARPSCTTLRGTHTSSRTGRWTRPTGACARSSPGGSAPCGRAPARAAEGAEAGDARGAAEGKPSHTARGAADAERSGNARRGADGARSRDMRGAADTERSANRIAPPTGRGAVRRVALPRKRDRARHRPFGLGALALAAVAGLALLPGAAAAQSIKRRPNVVVLMTDDESVSDVRHMPNVRRLLARRGTTFTNSFVSYPLCCPSRATFLTGQYAHNHGVVGNFPPGGYYGLRGKRNTLPVWLARAGYRTAHVGKYLNQYGTLNPREVPPGWDEWHGGVDLSTYDYFNYLLNHNGRLTAYGDPGYARALVEIGRATQRGQIDALSDLLALVDRLFTPGDFGARRGVTEGQNGGLRGDHRGRLGALQAVDEAVGRLVATLRRTGELDDTLFVFTSDNGWIQGEHRVPDNKYVAYEESIRVPLIIRGPGVPAGRRVDAPAVNVDLAATIVDAANTRPGRRLDGVSLLGRAGEPAAAPRRDVPLEALAPLFTGRDFPSPFAVPYYGVRTQRYKYIRWSYGDEELYDLRTDPYELRNLAADRAHGELKAELAAEARRLRGCAGASCR